MLAEIPLRPIKKVSNQMRGVYSGHVLATEEVCDVRAWLMNQSIGVYAQRTKVDRARMASATEKRTL